MDDGIVSGNINWFRQMIEFIKNTFVCGAIISLCLSCGVEKYYVYSQSGDGFEYKDSTIGISLSSDVDESNGLALIRLGALSKVNVTIDYIRPQLYYSVNGKKVQARIGSLQVIRSEEMGRPHSFIYPPVFESVTGELRQINSSKFIDYNFGFNFGDKEYIPNIDKITIYDSIGYSVNGKPYHFVKEIELTRRTKRYFWFLRDD